MKLKSLFLLTLWFISMVNAGEPKQDETAGEIMKFGIQAVLNSEPGKGDELAAIMAEALKVVPILEGCELYLVQQSLTDDTKILIAEVWENRQAHQASLQNEEIRKIVEKAKPIIASMEHQPARVIGGHGVSDQ